MEEGIVVGAGHQTGLHSNWKDTGRVPGAVFPPDCDFVLTVQFILCIRQQINTVKLITKLPTDLTNYCISYGNYDNFSW